METGLTPGFGHDATQQQMQDTIRALYDQGYPLFSRSALRDLGKQFAKRSQGTLERNEVVIRGLDGVEQRCPLPENGSVMITNEEAGWERVHAGFRIRYNSLQDMLRNPKSKYAEAYLSLEVDHQSVFRDLETKMVIPDPNQEVQAEMLSAAQLLTAFNHEKAKMEATETYLCIEELLTTQCLLKEIGKIVAFGCGSMSAELPARPEEWPTSVIQHTLVTSLRDLVVGKSTISHPGRISCYTQDPEYKATDKKILKEVGVTVVDDPEAFLKVDETSMLLSIAPGVPVKQIIADICRPAVMILSNDGTDIGTDPTSTRVEKMLNEHYVDLQTPAHPSLEDAVLYIRMDLYLGEAWYEASSTAERHHGCE